MGVGIRDILTGECTGTEATYMHRSGTLMALASGVLLVGMASSSWALEPVGAEELSTVRGQHGCCPDNHCICNEYHSGCVTPGCERRQDPDREPHWRSGLLEDYWYYRCEGAGLFYHGSSCYDSAQVWCGYLWDHEDLNCMVPSGDDWGWYVSACSGEDPLP